MPYPVWACRNRNFGPSGPVYLFADGFESGDFTKWSSTVIDGGDLAVTEAAALVGTYGMAALLDDNTAIYVQDNTPSAEKRYRCRFYFDPNSISMATNDTHYILYLGDTAKGYEGGLLHFNYNGSDLRIRAGAVTDAAAYSYSGYAAVSDAPHYIEVDWKASSAAGANDGFIYAWVDGGSEISATGIDNDTFVCDFVRLGAVTGIDTGTRGTYYFDAFASNNTGALIGA